jgi:hypothetical protein
VNSTKSREVICGGRITAAKINAEQARKQAIEATRDADRAEAHAWSLRIEGYGGPAQPSPAIAQCLNAGYGFLEVKCQRRYQGQHPARCATPRAQYADLEVGGVAQI